MYIDPKYDHMSAEFIATSTKLAKLLIMNHFEDSFDSMKNMEDFIKQHDEVNELLRVTLEFKDEMSTTVDEFEPENTDSPQKYLADLIATTNEWGKKEKNAEIILANYWRSMDRVIHNEKHTFGRYPSYEIQVMMESIFLCWLLLRTGRER